MKKTEYLSQMTRLGFAAIAAISLSACNTMDRLAQIGEEPPLTEIANPVATPGYKPVSMPMPEKDTTQRQANSLWRPGSRSFFKDQRANEIGDILTVRININDKAALSNTSKTSRTGTDGMSVNGLFGLPGQLTKVLPEDVTGSNLVDLNSTRDQQGAGTVDRDEKIDLKVAAVITQKLPNGNMVLLGRQEVRVNYEVRELQIAGVIRPQDIESDNSISYEKIAEARISYGGRGHISDVQQPRYGSQALDILLPF